jgi:hypothetical protein
VQIETLATNLTQQYATTLPQTLIAVTVEAAGRVGAGDPAVVELTARADVQALADAVRRSPTAGAGRS